MHCFGFRTWKNLKKQVNNAKIVRLVRKYENEYKVSTVIYSNTPLNDILESSRSVQCC